MSTGAVVGRAVVGLAIVGTGDTSSPPAHVFRLSLRAQDMAVQAVAAIRPVAPVRALVLVAKLAAHPAAGVPVAASRPVVIYLAAQLVNIPIRSAE